MQNRKNLFLILKEAINNSVKHSDCKHLTVSIIQQHDIAELIVKDDGVGFDMESTTQGDYEASVGNGLNNIRSRATELKADIEFKSERGKGTFLRLTFKRN
jgi:signal transduction histidine kinase